MKYSIKRLLDPSIFQGKYRKKNYFEGWYFKLISADRGNAMAVIPGISLGSKPEEAHAFIQFLDAVTGKTEYIKYNIDAFKYSEDRFEVWIDSNYFSDSHIILSIDNNRFSAEGRLEFKNMIRYPGSLFKPGIMGPYSFVPYMECIHAVISIHNGIEGSIVINDSTKDFTNGYGYIEKDRGRSFPDSWIWLQSNHFGNDDVSFMFSAAKIPWFGKDFPGIISFLRIENKLYILATYTGAKINSLNYNDNILSFIICNKKYCVSAKAVYNPGSTLKAPKNGLMTGQILETITAKVSLVMTDDKGSVIYKGTGENTGLEISDGIFEYIKSTKSYKEIDDK